MEQQLKKLKVSLVSFGCQMNLYDTEVAAGILEAAGYEVVGEDEMRNAECGMRNGVRRHQNSKIQNPKSKMPKVILINTCSVREHAEDRVYGRLGMLAKEKRENPNLIVGLLGCMVEEHKEKLFKRFPELDFMVGTRNVKELPALIDEAARSRKQVARIQREGLSIEYTNLIKRESKFHAWLPVMTGCDKVCTFCIVPVTRGREVSMPAHEVCREASRLVSEGVKWITLLGQNVNSYRGAANREPRTATELEKIAARGTWHADRISFPALLEMLCQIEGLERISFTTSHPSDATEELFQVIARNPKISRRFHLPLQSASDRILKRMKRLHQFDEYRAKINRLRELVPDISITTDLIAGFSGETDEDHAMTVRSLKELRFDGAYIYKYSVRPGTPAAKLKDTVPEEVKIKRHAELLALQRAITAEENHKWIGRSVSVFAEAVSTKNPKQLTGRTDQDKKVVFEGSQKEIGTFVKARLTDLRHETFNGSRL